MVKRDTRYVGKYLSTKAVGSNKREDVTDQYKFPEGEKTDLVDLLAHFKINT